MTTPSINTVTPSEVERAIDVIVLAFGADPLFRYVYPEAGQYLKYSPDVVRAFCGGAFEHGTAFYVQDFLGAALWLPPDVHPDEDAMGELLQRTIPEQNQEDFFALFEQMGSYHPDEPHWYLPLIGVDPAQQNKGYGSELLKHSLVECDLGNKLAYLESTNPRNIPLYERHGFEVLGTLQVGTSPPVSPMLRKPR
ncbi:MAG: GNAT family N-acetyltransferase [Chloroflexi bacterium]|nr:GNAT family N-acetyltransferase [Chloroflexota bacterium]